MATLARSLLVRTVMRRDISDMPEELNARTISRAGTDANIRDEELLRMAAFRLREAANRIATLANSAQDDRLRSALILVCERLSGEERRLSELTPRR